MMEKLIISVIFITTIFAQTIFEKSYKLKDGSVIIGTVIEESDESLLIQTKFGSVSLNKDDLIRTKYEVKLNSGEIFIGFKTKENSDSLTFSTKMGDLIIRKSEIMDIQEVGKEINSTDNDVQPEVHYRRPYSFSDFLFGGKTPDKDSEFVLGEEQLIDLFFDPTGYTLDRSMMYLSGLSFGFGVTDKLQITTKWGSFFWGDMNLRPKVQIFEKGNWEKQSSLSLGLHYHSRWWPDKYKWKSGSITDSTVTNNTVEKYWGGYYRIGEEPEFEIIEYEWDNSQYLNRIDTWDNGHYFQMLEIFGAFSYSTARKGLRGRVSHTFGGNIQIMSSELLYRGYYGIDIDVNRKLKMVGEIFYDPHYLELYQLMESDREPDYEDLSESPLKESKYNPVHVDFGFIYALNESFRFGIHFQKPFVIIYWKF